MAATKNILKDYSNKDTFSSACEKFKDFFFNVAVRNKPTYPFGT